MSLSLGFLVVDIATIVCAALLGVRVLTSRSGRISALLIAVIMFDSVCDVVLGRHDYQYWIPAAFHFELGPFASVLNLARNLTASLFMLLCFVLFAGKRAFPRWIFLLVVAQLFLEEPIRALLPAALSGNRFWTGAAPALLQTFFVGVALYWTMARWRDDLSEASRRLRILTTIIIAVDLIASGLLTRVLIPPDTIANYYAHESLIVSHLAILLFILFRLSEGNVGELLSPAEVQGNVGNPAKPQKPIDPELAAALVRLTKLLEEEHVYRRPGLSLKDLSNLVGLPEYRLRKTIHEELGHQNFNVFLHEYRIAEACARLRDPAQRRVPILTIALSVGYQSINTFNRGFRDVMDMTPSAYRAYAETAQHPTTAEKIAPETA